jgi:Spy/CpxP family protein refolding chaperone
MTWNLTILLVTLMILPGGTAAAQSVAPPAAQPPAQAKPPVGNPAPSREPWMMRWNRPGCAMLLMRGHLARLKQELNLSDAQLKDLEAVRIPFLTEAVGLRGNMEMYHVQLEEALSTDVPDEAKVLDIERKLREAYAHYEEDGTKAYIKMLGILTPEQRTQLCEHCSTLGPPGMGMRRWGGRTH